MKKLAFLLLLASIPAFGAISRSGSCATNSATSCTYSSIATGDLKLVFSYNNGSTTVPSLVSGWHSILQLATTTGGVTGAVRLACNVATSSGDTSTGTWTNATGGVVAIAYSGTGAAASTCATNNIGMTNGQNAKTSTTLKYGSGTLTLNNATSWVTGWAATSAGAICNVSSLPSVVSNGSSPGVGGSDSNGSAGSTSWVSQSCTVSSGTWISIVAEVLQPVTPSFPPAIY